MTFHRLVGNVFKDSWPERRRIGEHTVFPVHLCEHGSCGMRFSKKKDLLNHVYECHSY